MTLFRASLVLSLAVLPVFGINNDTQISPGIGPLPAAFSPMGGMIIDIVGANGKRLTTQIPPSKLPIDTPTQAFMSIFTQAGLDSYTLQTRLGGGLQKVNIRITLQDGDSGSPNPVYTAVFGPNSMPYSGPGARCPGCIGSGGNAASQPAGYDFDAGTDLYVALPISGGYINCGYMGQTTTYQLDPADYHTAATYTGFPGVYALYPNQFTQIPKLGYEPFAVTGWFSVPSNQLTTLYNALLSTGSLTVGIWDVDPGDQYYDFTQGVANSVSEIPLIPPEVISFTATPSTVVGSGTVTLSWQTSHASSIAIDNGVVVNATQVNGSTTVTVSTSTTFTLTASGPDGSATATATVTVLPPLAITTTSFPPALAGSPYSFSLAAAGGTAPYRWILASGSLPSGLSLNADGTVSGTPTTPGTSTFVAQITDATTPTQTATAAFTLQVNPGLAITTTALPGAVTGAAYSHVLSATGGTAPYSWALASGTLPAGLSLASDGPITGTVTATASATFAVRATDSTAPTPQSVTHTYTVSVGPALAIQTATLPSGIINVPYSQSLAAAGGTAPYTWSLATGPLPAGLTLSSSGTISGTPTSAGLTTFTVRVVDSTSPSSQASTQTLSIYIVDALAIDTTTLPDGTASHPYAQALLAHNGTPPYVWTLSSGSLPPGISLLASGGIIGSPSTAGQYRFTIKVSDSGVPATQNATRDLVLNVSRAFTITTTALPGGSSAVPYSAAISAQDGIEPYSFAVVFGALPPGLSLSATGQITGTPTKPGVYNMLVRSTDSTNPTPQISDRPLSITVDSSLSIVTPSLPDGTDGVPYTFTLAALNGLQPYVWTLTGGSLPDGLSLLLSGTIVGTPTKAGTFHVTIQAADSDTPTPAISTRSFTFQINTPLTITNTALPNGLTSTPYVAIITTTGAQPPYAYALTDGNLPPGLALSDIGVIAGTPTTPGHYVFTIQSQDSMVTPLSTSKVFSIDINQPLQVSTEALPVATLDTIYSQQLAAAGGLAPYTWSTTDTLPPGLQLLSTGVLIGVPTRAGSYTFTAQLTDISNPPQNTSREYTLTITPPLAITNTPFPAVLPSVSYASAAHATGGVPPYTWSLTTGSLPGGLVLSTDGTISGVTAASGAYTITLTATDSAPSPHSSTREFVLLVAAPFAVTSTSPLTTAIIGRAYHEQLTMSGGKLPVSCSVDGGSLPPGLALAADGAISGTPTSTAPGNFVVRCKDSADESAVTPLTILVQPALGILGRTIEPIVAKTVYFHLFEASDGTPPFHWSVTGGSLPAGLTLTDGGLLTGTATSPGSYPVTLTVTDSTPSGQQTATLSPTLVVVQALTAVPQQLAGTTGVAFKQTLTATGGTPPYSWSLGAGQLPPGLTLKSGEIAGTPSASIQSSVVLNVTDANGLVASAVYPLTITGALTIPLSNDAVPPAVKGQSYAAALSAYGGNPPYRWSITSGTLPAGMTLSSAGVISGIATASGSFPFTVSVSDAGGQTAVKQYTLTVQLPAQGPTIPASSAALPTATTGVVYTASLLVTGGTSPYTWAIASGSLPPGLALTGATIVGTPTTAGVYSFSLSVTDAAGLSSSSAYVVTVRSSLTITTSSLPSAAVGRPVNVALTAANGTPPYAWSMAPLVPNLQLSTAGILSGAAATSGQYAITLTVTDSSTPAPQTANKTLQLTILPALTITTVTLPVLSATTSARLTLGAQGGTAPYLWSADPGTLPPGLQLATNGVISGTPSAPGSYTPILHVTDSGAFQQTASAQFSLLVTDALTILTTDVPPAKTGLPYTLALQARGGTPPSTWRLAAGFLPQGIALSDEGIIAGIPATPGSFPLTIAVSDSTGHTALANFTLVVTDPLVIATAALAPAFPGTAFTAALQARGGSQPYKWSLASGSLPTGVTLSPGGTLAGAPNTVGQYPLILQVTDAGSQTATAQFTLTVTEALAIVTTEIAPAKTGTPYAFGLLARGGTPPYTWRVTSGALPAGLVLSSAGVLSGTPQIPGTFAVRFTVTDADPRSVSVDISFSVADPLSIAPTSPPVARAGVAFKHDLQARGGTPPYTWSVVSGDLPPGLALTTSGSISGTPTTPRVSAFAVQVTDAGAQSAVTQFSLSVADGLAIITTTVPSTTTGVPVTFTFQARGGSQPYTWSLASGTLPPGITFSGAGQLAGTASVAGVYGVSVAVMDATSQTVKTQVTITVAESLSITSTSAPSGTPGLALTYSLQARGGTQPYSWAIASGLLPPGLSMSATGSITGTPTTPGTYTFTPKVTDSAAPAQAATTQLTFTIAAGLTITTTSLPAAQTALTYTFAFEARGGMAPYTWSLTTGSLPAGLILQPSGTIAGTPTSAGAATFAVTATDANGRTATQQFSLTVSDSLTITTTQLPLATVSTPFSYSLQARGGTASYRWAGTSILPAGITLAQNGTLSGTPTSTGTYTLAFRVNDSSAVPQTATGQLVLSVGDRLVIATTSLPPASSGVPYRATLDARGGTPPYTWRLAAGSLPAGLALTSSGVIAGSPTTPAPAAALTFEVADTQQHTATVTLQLAVSNPPTITLLLSPTAAILDPQRQEPLTVSLQTPYPSDITGTLTLTGTTDQDVAFVQASTSSQTIAFRIPAGSTTGVFAGPAVMLQTGTTAQPFAVNVTTDNPAQTLTQQYRILPRTPEITSTQFARTATGFSITVAGYSTTAEVQAATFRFFTSTSSSAPYTMPVTEIFKAWYSSAQSRGTGIFRYTQPFAMTGDLGTVTSVEVTLTNTVGTSSPVRISTEVAQ